MFLSEFNQLENMNKQIKKEKSKLLAKQLVLKQLRKKQGFAQDYIAQQLKISRPTLSAIEQGKKEMTFSQASFFAYLYKVKVNELVEVQENQKKSLLKLDQKLGSVSHQFKKLEQTELKQKTQDKLKEVILYTLTCIGAMRNFHIMRLKCILYFIESHYYRQYKLRLLNIPFYKTLRDGPYITGFEKVIKEMITDKDIKRVKTKLSDGSYNINYLVLQKINFKNVSANELLCINREIEQLRSKFLDIEHFDFYFFSDDFPWFAVKDYQKIDFSEHPTDIQYNR